MYLRASFVVFAAALSGCVSEGPKNLPRDEAAYALMPAPIDRPVRKEYHINPQDKLNIIVFQEPDLSVKEAQVETSGKVSIPLLGPMQAAGLTTGQFADAIQSQLKKRYLVDPRVSVLIAESQAQKVSVEGAVAEAGVFELRGDTTLLEAIALAKGVVRTSALRRVAILRNIDGNLQGALFDIDAIEKGKAADPAIEAGDRVIVGTSAGRTAFYDFLGVVPALGVFASIATR